MGGSGHWKAEPVAEAVRRKQRPPDGDAHRSINPGPVSRKGESVLSAVRLGI